jgi:hypothetical protein
VQVTDCSWENGESTPAREPRSDSLTGVHKNLRYMPAGILKNVWGVRILEQAWAKTSISLAASRVESEDYELTSMVAESARTNN